MIDEFVTAIRSMRKVKVHFFSKEDSAVLSRLCAPMDYGPSRRAKSKDDRFHLWDFESDERNHVLSLSVAQIASLEVIDEQFDPAEFVTWDTGKSPWFVARDWGRFS